MPIAGTADNPPKTRARLIIYLMLSAVPVCTQRRMRVRSAVAGKRIWSGWNAAASRADWRSVGDSERAGIWNKGYYSHIRVKSVTMSYSEFSLDDIKHKLGLTIREVSEVFTAVEPIAPSQLLKETLAENIPLALGIDTEKARSEMIVAPVLIELRRRCDRQISLFSGTEFNIDRVKGLNGVCDFMISHSPEQLSLNAPVFTLVEAKNDNIKSGIAQCIAEMLAAQIFNLQKDNSISCVYGAVTTGSIWRFMKLEDRTVYIETTEHFIENIQLILGILMQIVQLTRPTLPCL